MQTSLISLTYTQLEACVPPENISNGVDVMSSYRGNFVNKNNKKKTLTVPLSLVQNSNGFQESVIQRYSGFDACRRYNRTANIAVL